MRPPATVAEAVAIAAAAAPEIDLSNAVAVEGGWDSFVVDTGAWILRFPRRAEVEPALRAEVALLPSLAPALPVAIPRFEYVVEDPVLFVAYRKIDGTPLTRAHENAGIGRDVAQFLRALHSYPAGGAPVPAYDHRGWRARHEMMFDRFRETVVPLLPAPQQRVAMGLFDDFLETPFDFVPALVHYDLGPTHLLTRRGRLTGVIDWGDVAVADPAVDLAWALHGSSFGAVVAEAYGVTHATRERALLYHRLGPWHEVVHGQETGEHAWIESGLKGVLDRLPPEADAAR